MCLLNQRHICDHADLSRNCCVKFKLYRDNEEEKSYMFSYNKYKETDDYINNNVLCGT